MPSGAAPPSWQVPYDANTLLSVSMAGAITVTLRWVDSMGNPAPNPPAKVYVLQKAKASWGITLLHAGLVDQIQSSGTVNNGLGSPPTPVSSEYGKGMVAQGSRLLELNSSSGVVQLTLNRSAECTVSAPDDGNVLLICEHTVQLVAPARYGN